MALPIPPNNPNTPIPNNPFYSPETTFFCGAYYPALVTPTSGLTVNPNGTITVTGGGGGGGITALAAGPGIALSSTTGNVTVCTDLVAGPNIALSQSGNQIQISATGFGTGTVTAISAGNGLCSTSSPITTSGSLSLNTNCVIPPNAFNIKGNLLVGTGAGTYTALNPGTDGQVLVACAGSGSAGLCWGAVGSVTQVSATSPLNVTTGTTTPNITIDAASTSGAGAVQLNNTLASTSTTEALTAAQGKALQDQITALMTNPGIELAGTINASTGLMLSITSVGSSAGYTVGSSLPAASVTTKNTYVIVTEPGTLTPPGGSPTASTKGDWFLASQVSPGVYQWEFLNVGFDAPLASTTTAGLVELATSAETATGTDGTLAVTPAGASATYIAKSALTAKGDIISATSPSTPSVLGVGADGCILTACSSASTGLCWASAPITGIPCACITAKGTLISGTAASTPTALPVGADGQILVACSTASTGLCWATPPSSGIPCACIVGKGGLVTGTAGSTPVGLGVGLDGQILVACGAATTGLCWTNPPTVTPAIPCACLTAKGQLITTTTPSTPVALSVGTDGQVLVACSTAATGLCWATPTVATPTCMGVILGRVDCGSGGLGFRALNSLTTGVYNVGIAENAGCSITSGCRNVAIGGLALETVTTANDNIGIGIEALRRNTTGFNNVAIGTTTLVFNTSGANNVAIGCDASRANTTGYTNVAVGTSALFTNGDGFGNVAIGACAMRSNVSGINNVAVGTSSAAFSTSSGSVFVGVAAGRCVTSGARQVLVGESAGACLTVEGCSTAVGWSALPLATGAANIAIGCNAGCNITTGAGNVAIGNNSTVGNGTLSNQLALGNGAVSWLRGDGNGALCTYSGFVIKGTGAGGAANLTNCDTFFSQDASFGPLLNFGNTFGGGKSYVIFRTNGNEVGRIEANGTTGVSYVTTSDYRLKENVKDIEGATKVLRALPVREYNFITEPEVVHQGFLAHELQEFVPQAVSGKKDEVGEDEKPKYQGVDLSQVVPLLTAALKESIARIDALEEKVKNLEANG